MLKYPTFQCSEDKRLGNAIIVGAGPAGLTAACELL
jgi:ribulose 1,5-bisphosphate synthetase/thiazole synthase